MTIVNVDDSDFRLRMSKIILLTNGVIPVNDLGCLHLDILLIAIHFIGDEVAKMLDFVEPAE